MDKDTFFRKKTTINAGGKLIDMALPKVMGIINTTPDSFFADSRKMEVDAILQQAGKMLNEGADFLDIGAYSSRPGAADISAQEETDRLLPAVEAIVKDYPEAIISIDTFRANVAETAIKAGAHIINDISGGGLDDDMFSTVARLQVPYILMHMKGNPQNMQALAEYDDVFGEVYDYFVKKIYALKQLGVHDVIIDPGFGFAKKPEHSYALMNRMQELERLQLPVLAGISRKKMIYGLLGTTAAEALNGTTALNTIALMKGANILRVHDVKAAVEAITIFKATTLGYNNI
ncbi:MULTISPECIES: dihydropteroate synthase [unclassified Mucilaginibacter]|uniref:dihydropteroate synthase n=2 Tax=unclassified Mucilaginibacter TaxID=2617802 RepID=UPI00095FCA53|nr:MULTISPECIES: dihydropteroate synthase [unclassified Mucilaginibacter]OJW12887.1 MAG: dihydropteroate synthase [Mucilaginibacter sp. 44-25]PLW91581.1 MAG: dihydropteroate synthase [Mucilaginibacter sp.]HEK20757.1 dihydropteroate synthase [Bacteroidota bacterium]